REAVERRKVEVLVVGGGCSGMAAAVAVARRGRDVLLVEESPWLGGMITAAGVSCIDGNEGALGGGLYGEFRAAMEAYYGGAEAVRTGWVSNTCFEPHVAANWFDETARTAGFQRLHGARLERVLREGDRIVGAVFAHGESRIEVRADVTIEATEYGDVLRLGGVPFRIGRESKELTGEAHAPDEGDDEIQDLTMVATLRRIEGGAAPVPLPTGESTERFHNSTAVHCKNPDPAYWNHKLHSWESFLKYGLLPERSPAGTAAGAAGKTLFMLNWPFHANDYPAQGLFDSMEERAATIRAAKERTLAYVHYIQQEMGHPEWGLARGIYPTADHLPLIPYVRESRRVVPVRWFREEDVVPQGGSKRNVILPDGIAVGDYYLDHHHDLDHRPPGERLGESYPSNAPFQVPYSALVPRDVDGLLAAEKSIGATHIVNGCSRLQPVVMLIGQAAGIAAALAVEARCQPREVDVALVQAALLAAGAQVVPDRDCPGSAVDFAERQLAQLRGDRA
ncbi:MAG: FAD-dependent oxidoreductase, partial [Planctomycetota bacterium]